MGRSLVGAIMALLLPSTITQVFNLHLYTDRFNGHPLPTRVHVSSKNFSRNSRQPKNAVRNWIRKNKTPRSGR